MSHPELDLILEREVPVSPELVWRAWTEPQRLLHWFTPAPWRTVACDIDLRPGGRFHTVMRSPEGEDFPNEGCYLEVVEQRRLVWTNTLGAGFRPQRLGQSSHCGEFPYTAILQLSPRGSGTLYRATVLHADAEGLAQHAALGFHEGWGAALDQLVAFCQSQG